MSANTKVTSTKTKTVPPLPLPRLKQETYNLSDLNLKHELHCGFVELGDSVSVA